MLFMSQSIFIFLGQFPFPQIIPVSSVMVHEQLGKEFPDMRQNERRIKFIREGDMVRTAGWLKGELNLFAD